MSETKNNAVLYSDSPRKNISQQVFHNVGPDGKKFSITRHVLLDSSKPGYRRFKKGVAQ